MSEAQRDAAVLRLEFEQWLANHADLRFYIAEVQGPMPPRLQAAVDILLVLIWSRASRLARREALDRLWLKRSMVPTWKTRFRQWWRRLAR